MLRRVVQESSRAVGRSIRTPIVAPMPNSKLVGNGMLRRAIHASSPAAFNPIGIGLTVAVGAVSLRYILTAYEKWQASRPKGSVATASKYYKGPFMDEMTRGEAAKILGVRESAPTEKIRERHRKLLILNHPDAGGSTFLASKINEAKDKLLQGS